MPEVEATVGRRPSLAVMLERVARLTGAEARELAELDRVDWTDNRRPGLTVETVIALGLDLLARGSETGGFGRLIGEESASNKRAAAKRAKRLLGAEASTIRSDAKVALAADATWPGRRLADAMFVVAITWTTVTVAAWLVALMFLPDSWVWLLMGMNLLTAASWLAVYLLPPGRRHLNHTIETTALAHAAADRLSQRDFETLAGGWYAVLGGGWRRGARPFLAWGCLVVGIGLLIVFGYLINGVYEQLYPGEP